MLSFYHCTPLSLTPIKRLDSISQKAFTADVCYTGMLREGRPTLRARYLHCTTVSYFAHAFSLVLCIELFLGFLYVVYWFPFIFCAVLAYFLRRVLGWESQSSPTLLRATCNPWSKRHGEKKRQRGQTLAHGKVWQTAIDTTDVKKTHGEKGGGCNGRREKREGSRTMRRVEIASIICVWGQLRWWSISAAVVCRDLCLSSLPFFSPLYLSDPSHQMSDALLIITRVRPRVVVKKTSCCARGKTYLTWREPTPCLE